ncbi:hypothetical protein [Erwinia psidii]|uniref:Uncharacterized protein n=1 Tax=Erwinia psidii TaxID=69224 RepID=A0A3N6UPN7_9GAMM|nr:hypothetical protein [Erwinia psidii]MCX8957024.1 hypothetical protein [Erwinia psidii]MCX8965282.1 hypothetical protein [Erwinia psidii]RQM37919.1 hypothetical protein EB241_11555 [Erwinia psidii]
MKMNEIIPFCKDIRAVMENMKKSDHCSDSSLSMSTFPEGCCEDTSQILAYLLHQYFGIVPEVITGKYYKSLNEGTPCGLSNGNSHAWIVVNDHIIDLTADQFNDRGYNHPSIMITTDSTFHDLFSDRREALQPLPCKDGVLTMELSFTASKIEKALLEKGWIYRDKSSPQL